MSAISTRKTLDAVDPVVSKLYPAAQAKEVARKTKQVIEASAGEMHSANWNLLKKDEIAGIEDAELRQIAFLAVVAGSPEQFEQAPAPWAHSSADNRSDRWAAQLGVTMMPLPDSHEELADWLKG